MVLCRPDGGSASLLVVLHGRGQDAEEMQQMTRIDERAAESGMVTVYATATGGRWGDDTFTSPDRPSGDEDVTYLEALISDLEERHIAIVGRVGVVGFSNGASMALRYASQRPDSVRAVVSVAGQLPLDPAVEPNTRTPVMLIAGDRDPIRPYQTGVVPTAERQQDSPTPTRSTPATADAFVRLADTPTLEQMTTVLNPVTTDGTSVRRQTWTDKIGVVAELYTVEGGGHTWPKAARIPPSFASYGVTSQDIDASRLAVDFVADFQP